MKSWCTIFFTFCLFSVVPIFPCGKRQKCCVTFFHFFVVLGWPLQERTVYPSSHTITWQFEYWWSKLHKCDKANVEKKMMTLLDGKNVEIVAENKIWKWLGSCNWWAFNPLVIREDISFHFMSHNFISYHILVLM